VIGLISLFVLLILSFLITRIATVALTLTGLSEELSRFQALSAFSGVGFTTSESEYVVQYPVRRHIITILIILGNAGVVTTISSLILSFSGVAAREGISRFLWLVAGMGLLWLILSSRWLEDHLSRLIRWTLRQWTTLELRDYAHLLQLTGGYSVMEITIEPEHWLASRTLQALDLHAEGITVLAIHRQDGGFVGVPRRSTRLEPGDRLVIYGREDLLAELALRLEGVPGDRAHHQAVAKQEQIWQAEQEAERQQAFA
jgi:hypothetical protein